MNGKGTSAHQSPAVARPPVTTTTAALSRPQRRHRVKAAESIIETLRADIASGALPPGARLPTERDLAAHFGVSQPTVREAVRGLEAVGLVESRHGSGVYVNASRQDFVSHSLETLLQMQQAHILDVFDVRRALGIHSVRRASEGVTAADIDNMESALRQAAEATDPRAIADAILDFQVTFSAAAGNALLTAIETVLVRILLQIQTMAYAEKDDDWWRQYADELLEHRQDVMRSLRAGDHQAVEHEWTRYLDAQYERFRQDPVLSQVTLDDRQAIAAVRDIAISLGPRLFTGRDGDS
ncbi:FadR/GntR family transcriptional regulator [Streptomyces sp. 900105755]|uniref:FadR/GntR family transcriptional regulator n=1 Tax=Streptomyces sp. 900105755 TaxID=3154389 RepID=UPI0033182434